MPDLSSSPRTIYGASPAPDLPHSVHAHANNHASSSTLRSSPRAMTTAQQSQPYPSANSLHASLTSSSLNGASEPPQPSTSKVKDISSSSSIGGVADGSKSENGEGGEKPTKKRKKKGWKGWALVLEDEQGNVIEVQDDEDTPPLLNDGQTPVPSREGSTAAASDGHISRSKQKSSSPFATPKNNHGPSTANTTRSTPAPAPASRSTPKPSELKQSGDPPANKKRRKNSPTTASSTPQPEPLPPKPSTHKAAPAPAPVTAKPKAARHSLPPSVPVRSGTAAAREGARQAQASSRLGTPTAPTTTNTTSTTPAAVTDDILPPKVPRVGMGEVYAPPPESDIRAEAAFIIDAAKRKREEDRIRHLREISPGGEQVGFTPPPSARPTDETKAPPPPHNTSSKHIRSEHTNGNAPKAGKAAYNGTLGVAYHTPVTAPSYRPTEDFTATHSHRPSSRASQHVPEAGPSTPSSTASGSRRQSAISAPPHDFPAEPNDTHHLVHQVGYPDEEEESYPETSFEAQFSRIQDSYRNLAYSTTGKSTISPEFVLSTAQQTALGRGPNDPPPPKFHTGQKPTIVLTPGGTKLRPRDRVDRAHQEGFEGLTPEIETDCEGFLDNVRDNLRNIILYFFPQPSSRREAFLERIGRGLIEMGWQLTDNGDLALNLQQVPVMVQPRPQHRGSIDGKR